MPDATTLPAPDANRYLECLRSDAHRLAQAAAGHLDDDVPRCPGWRVRDVLEHTGNVYLHKVANMRTAGPAEFPATATPDDDPVAWFLGAQETLVTELVSRGPTAPSYTWFPGDQTVGFWFRRMAHETAVHRVDVEAAAGEVSPVEDDLAVDGVDEVLLRFLPSDEWRGLPVEQWQGLAPEAGAGRPIAVRTGGRAWRVVMQPDGVEVAVDAAASGSADAVVTGEPSEVLLWLWGRRPDSAVHVEGDQGLVRTLRARLAIATE